MANAPTLPRAITKALEPAGNALAADAERISRQLQKALEAIHGACRVSIDHNAGFVLVVVQVDKRVKP